MDTNNEESTSLGKKVFFLYPPSVVRDEVVARLMEQEFEIYMLRDHVGARRILRLYPNSLLFVNLDEGQTEDEWAKWILDVLGDSATAGVHIGIISYNTDEKLKRKYLMDIGIQCGFVQLKLGIDESTRILLETLKANEAKGRRKYVRASCASDRMSLVNLRTMNGLITGSIRDISVVGFSCFFDPDPHFPKNAILRDIQLKLRGILVSVEGIVYGTREDGGTVYVVLFTQKVDDIARSKIRRYIRTALQAEIEAQAKG
jgi:hypothetical protein